MKVHIFLTTFLAATVVWAKPCLERQGALDIGSGSTKAFAAVVDTCQNKIVETLYDRQVPIAFSEAVAGSGNGEIPPEMIRKAADEIKLLIKGMQEKKLSHVSAIATSAFRSAKNGSAAAEELAKRTSVSVKVLSQDEEAEIGARSARASGGITAENEASVIVWDIGGGSMQMWSKKKQENAHIFRGDLASVSFKNRIIREIQKKDIQKVSSPNPLGKDHEKAVRLAADHAREHVPAFFKQNAVKSRWLGIGGVLAISVKNQIGKSSSFSRSDLEKILARRAKLSDAEIESSYRSTEISNLALVLGYMQALGIEKIETVEASLVQGWLIR